MIKVAALELAVVLCKGLETDQVEKHRSGRRIVRAVVERRDLGVADE